MSQTEKTNQKTSKWVYVAMALSVLSIAVSLRELFSSKVPPARVYYYVVPPAPLRQGNVWDLPQRAPHFFHPPAPGAIRNVKALDLRRAQQALSGQVIAL